MLVFNSDFILRCYVRTRVLTTILGILSRRLQCRLVFVALSELVGEEAL